MHLYKCKIDTKLKLHSRTGCLFKNAGQGHLLVYLFIVFQRRVRLVCAAPRVLPCGWDMLLPPNPDVLHPDLQALQPHPGGIRQVI